MTQDELIAKLEVATEGSRELDAEIWRVADPPACKIADYQSRAFTGRDWTEEEKAEAVAARMKRLAPHFTTSLDAADTLRTPGWTAIEVQSRGAFARWRVELSRLNSEDMEQRVEGRAATEPLARCIAALKARAA